MKENEKREYQQQILIYIWIKFEMVELGNNKMSSFMRHNRQKNTKFVQQKYKNLLLNTQSNTLFSSKENQYKINLSDLFIISAYNVVTFDKDWNIFIR